MDASGASAEVSVDGLRDKLQKYNGLDVSDIWKDDDDDCLEECGGVVEKVNRREVGEGQVEKEREEVGVNLGEITVTSHCQEDTEVTFEPSASLLTVGKGAARKEEKKKARRIAEESFRSTSSRGSSSRGRVYFRSSVVEFGEKAVGTCGSMRLQLCNSTDSDVVVRVAEPSTPFVVLHKKIRIKANAFVRLPVRFIPMAANFYESLLHVDSGGGREQLVVLLRGRGK